MVDKLSRCLLGMERVIRSDREFEHLDSRG
jgi:hypothetical protein